VITRWRGKEKSKQQIKEDIDNFIKENVEQAKGKDCYNINKDQVLVEMEELSGKEKMMKQKRKLREKKETEKIFIDNDLTKQEREIQKKLTTIAKEEKREGK
jgi:septum formation inhibitor MinC